MILCVDKNTFYLLGNGCIINYFSTIVLDNMLNTTYYDIKEKGAY